MPRSCPTWPHWNDGLDLSGNFAFLHFKEAEAAQEALDAAATVGNAVVAPDPAFTSEDFAFMLQACKGAYIWLGQAKGDGGTPLHNPHYDFNDDVLALGIKLHVALAERHLAR